jgi:methionyl aminopeptidase
MTVALEPMVLVKNSATRVTSDEWTVVSMDGLPTAHFEHTVAVTENGPMILTLLENRRPPVEILGPGHLSQVSV